MNTIQMLLAQPIFRAVGWALIHFVWQGMVVAALFASLSFLLRRSSANLRYAGACAALLLMLALPVATTLVVRRSLGAEAVAVKLVKTPLPRRWAGELVEPKLTLPAPEMEAAESWAGPSSLVSLTQEALADRVGDWLPWLVALWLAGVLGLSLRVLGGWMVARRLKRCACRPAPGEWQRVVARLSKRLRLSKPVRLCESAVAQVPTVIGWLRPVILVPVSALTGLSPQQLEALLAHELAHIRRHDYLVNLLQTAIETLLFYHPAVWWVSRRIRIEREHCCDDLAVAVCGDVLTYARALTELEGLRVTGAPQLAVAANGGSLLARIRRLLESPAPSPHRSSTWLASLIAMATILCIWAAARTTLRAHAMSVSVAPILESGPCPHNGTAMDFALHLSAHASTAMASINDTNPVVLMVRAGDPDADPPVEAAQSPRVPAEPAPALEARPVAPAAPPAPAQESRSEDGTDFIGALEKLGYSNLTVDQLIELRDHGVTAGFILDLKSLGYRPSPVNQLVKLRDHGVTVSYIKALAALGYEKLPIDKLIYARDHGLNPDFATEVEASGYGRPPLEELINMRDHGVSISFLKELEAAGYGHLPLDRIIEARDHGVTAEYLKELKQQGYGHLSLEAIIRLRDHGVTPSFLAKVKARGWTNLSVEDLVRLRDSGILD